MAGRAPKAHQSTWSSSSSRFPNTLSNSASSTPSHRQTPSQPSMAPIPPAPVHPVSQMQGAFEESMRETMADSDADRKTNPYLHADSYQRRKLLLENPKYERTVAGRWLQKPGENFHPLWKLVAQISFGMHLLQTSLARSDADVIQILQTHVDEIDGFLERTTEDFDLAQKDILDRIKHLRTPLEHGDVFDTMLGDREFRTAIVEGNEKIEHILNRTSVAMKDSLKDVQKGLDGTKQLARFLRHIDRNWPGKSEEHAAVYSAMMGNTEGWADAYKGLQQKGNELNHSVVQLEGIVSEIQRRAGVASRRNLRQSFAGAQDGRARSSMGHSTAGLSPYSARSPISPNELSSRSSPIGTPAYLAQALAEPATTIAIAEAAKASRAIELPVASQLESSDQSRAQGAHQETEANKEGGVVGRTGKASAPARPDHISEQFNAAEPEPAIPPEVDPTSQPQGQTFFGYAPSDTGSASAQSPQSKARSLLVIHAKNDSSISSHLQSHNEEGFVNIAHPLLQDIRAQEAIPKNAGDASIRVLKTSSSAGSLVPRNPFRDSGSVQHSESPSDASAVAYSNRDSDNTVTTSMSSASDQCDFIKPSPRNKETRTAPPILPPIDTGASLNFKDPTEVGKSPISPSLAELTSATVSGPDMGDPFAPTSPAEGPRHPELINKIAHSIKESDSTKEARTHSRAVSQSRREPAAPMAQSVTTQPAITQPVTSKSAASQPETSDRATMQPLTTQPAMVWPITRQSVTGQPAFTTTTTTTSGLNNHLHVVTTRSGLSTVTTSTVRTGIQPQTARGPSSPPLATQYRNLSPFPSSASRGSHRPSASVPNQVAAPVENQSPIRKSGFKNIFSVKRGRRKGSVSPS